MRIRLTDRVLDLDRGLVVHGAEEHALTATEAALLRYLAAAGEAGATREALLGDVWRHRGELGHGFAPSFAALGGSPAVASCPLPIARVQWVANPTTERGRYGAVCARSIDRPSHLDKVGRGFYRVCGMWQA